MINITLEKFNKLTDAKKIPYITLLESIKAKEVLPFDIDSLTWDEVKGINKKLKKDEIFEALEVVFKIDNQIDIVKYFQLKKFIIEKFIYLHKNEATLLSSADVNAGLWELAGGRKLDVFSDNLPLSQLAKIYGGYPFDYGKKPYIEIVYLLKMNKEQSEVDNAYQELKYKQK